MTSWEERDTPHSPEPSDLRRDSGGTVPASAPGQRPAPRRYSRTVLAVLVATGMVASAVTGGAVGTVATLRALNAAPSTTSATSVSAPAQAALTAPPSAARPVLAQFGAPASNNVAGAVFARVNPAVVQIVSAGQAGTGPMRSGSGSGFVIDANGSILTNNHVVEGARSISVRFSSGTTREAQVVGTDRGNDVALLKVDLPQDTPVVLLGNSDQTEVGETALAIGSPFGLEGTVTQGIISAVSRTWQPGNGRVRRNLLQTDAPINPGNSGGPLLNVRGEVIGINTMIESPVRGSVGIGFAVPINLAKRLLPQLEAGARLEPVWLGIAGLQLDAPIARDQGLTVQSGVLVLSVVPDAPAAKAGIRGGQGANERIARGGDVIVAVDGTPVKDMTALSEQLSGRKPGDTITVTVARGSQTLDLSVTLQAWPAEN